MRPNEARNDLVSANSHLANVAPMETAPEPKYIESQKTSNLLRSMEKQGMFGPPENIPEGIIPPGFQAMTEPIPLSAQSIPVQRMGDRPKRLIRDLPTQYEIETLIQGDVIEKIPTNKRTTEQNNILREARALRVVHPNYIKIAGAIGRGGGIDFKKAFK
jgi:hypothetical protein